MRVLPISDYRSNQHLNEIIHLLPQKKQINNYIAIEFL
jgi:hypothetical protein